MNFNWLIINALVEVNTHGFVHLLLCCRLLFGSSDYILAKKGFYTEGSYFLSSLFFKSSFTSVKPTCK
jgi:hypothetical protein